MAPAPAGHRRAGLRARCGTAAPSRIRRAACGSDMRCERASISPAEPNKKVSQGGGSRGGATPKPRAITSKYSRWRTARRPPHCRRRTAPRSPPQPRRRHRRGNRRDVGRRLAGHRRKAAPHVAGLRAARLCADARQAVGLRLVGFPRRRRRRGCGGDRGAVRRLQCGGRRAGAPSRVFRRDGGTAGRRTATAAAALAHFLVWLGGRDAGALAAHVQPASCAANAAGRRGTAACAKVLPPCSLRSAARSRSPRMRALR